MDSSSYDIKANHSNTSRRTWGISVDASFGKNANSLGNRSLNGLLPVKRCLPAVQPFAEWQVNTPNCSICNVALGKRRLKPRHHCRVCGKCVCSKCSPNFISLPHTPGTHRACKLCVAIVHKP